MSNFIHSSVSFGPLRTFEASPYFVQLQQALRRIDPNPPAGDVDVHANHRRPAEPALPRAAPFDHQQAAAGTAVDPHHLADALAGDRLDRAAHELMVVIRRPRRAAAARSSGTRRSSPASRSTSSIVRTLRTQPPAGRSAPAPSRPSTALRRRSDRVQNVAPTRNRSSTKSVSGVTITWPRMPCGRAMRPTSTMSSQSANLRGSIKRPLSRPR